MSLEPHWYSTMYGVLLIAGQALSGLAFITAVTILLSRHAPVSDVLGPDRLHDLGKLMLAFVMFWAYVAFSQYLIIWAGNLPEEIPWYLAAPPGGLGLVRGPPHRCSTSSSPSSCCCPREPIATLACWEASRS